MKNLESFCVSEEASVQDAISSIQVNESRCVIVMGEGSKVVGVFSEGDVLRAVLAGHDMHTPLKKLLNPTFKYLQSEDFAGAVKLFRRGITLVPVVDNDFALRSVMTLQEFLEGLELGDSG